jgi:hypothetical protein
MSMPFRNFASSLTAVLLVSASVAGAQDIPEDFVVTLERTAKTCGSDDCPEYSVSIDSRGNVTFDGREHVRVIGRAVDQIPISLVREIAATVERVGFFKLLERYREIRLAGGLSMTTTHGLTSFVTVTSNGETKRVEDYLGAPPGLKELERQIEDATRPQRWTRIDVPTLRQLVADGRPPSAEQQDELLRRALYADEVDVVRALLEIGADPSTLRSGNNVPPLMIVRSAAAATALIQAGADPLVRTEHGQTPLGTAVWESPQVTGALLEAGVPADFHVDLDNTTALISAARVGNVGVVRLLLAAGADPRRRVRSGSALDSARRAKASAQTNDPLASREGFGTQPRFVEDFDAVIEALEDALANRR